MPFVPLGCLFVQPRSGHETIVFRQLECTLSNCETLHYSVYHEVMSFTPCRPSIMSRTICSSICARHGGLFVAPLHSFFYQKRSRGLKLFVDLRPCISNGLRGLPPCMTHLRKTSVPVTNPCDQPKSHYDPVINACMQVSTTSTLHENDRVEPNGRWLCLL